MTGTIQERFEKKFVKGDGCWEWVACKNSCGYGQFGFRGLVQGAHRVAWTLYVGEIPDGMGCLHRCDNPACVRPDHLFLGTVADNAHDRDNKGRGYDRSGEKNGMSKLTDTQVRTIRAMRGEGARGVDLAKEFGVTPQKISNIVHYLCWEKI